MGELFHEGAGVKLRVVVPEGAVRSLVIHGMWPDPERWTGAREALGAVLYDRRGHGGSPAPQPYVGTTVEEQSEDAARVLEAIGAPAVAVAGEDLGALVALDLARRYPARVSALALADTVWPQLLPDGADWLAGVVGRRPPVPADIPACTSWEITRRELRAIDVPAVVVTSPLPSSYAVRSADALVELLPGARRMTDGDLVAALNALI